MFNLVETICSAERNNSSKVINGSQMPQLPVKIGSAESEKPPLWRDILTFSKGKVTLAILLILIGLSGFIIPIVPGLLLIILAIALFKKGWMEKIRSRIRLWRA